MKLNQNVFMMWIVFTLSPLVFPHGEDVAGPNGGKIRMPGAFHTELKMDKTDFKIWLLDMEFKNPSIRESSINAHLMNKNGKKTVLKCSVKENYYFCKNKLSLKNIKSVFILAQRENMAGAEVEYPLPLE